MSGICDSCDRETYAGRRLFSAPRQTTAIASEGASRGTARNLLICAVERHVRRLECRLLLC